MAQDKSGTIELVELRQLANKKSKLRVAAQRALTQAELLNKQSSLGKIMVIPDQRCIQVYNSTGSLQAEAKLAN
jgi:hypothetical protein